MFSLWTECLLNEVAFFIRLETRFCFSLFTGESEVYAFQIGAPNKVKYSRGESWLTCSLDSMNVTSGSNLQFKTGLPRAALR